MLNYIQDTLEMTKDLPWGGTNWTDETLATVTTAPCDVDTINYYINAVVVNFQTESYFKHYEYDYITKKHVNKMESEKIMFGVELANYLKYKFSQPYFSKLAVVNFLNKWIQYYCITEDLVFSDNPVNNNCGWTQNAFAWGKAQGEEWDNLIESVLTNGEWIETDSENSWFQCNHGKHWKKKMFKN